MQKHAKQLKCDVNSKQFKDTMRYLWMPRLVERIQAAAGASTSTGTTSEVVHHHQTINPNMVQIDHNNNNTGVTNSSTGTASSENSFGTPVSDLTDCCYNYPQVRNQQQDCFQVNQSISSQLGESLISSTGYFHHALEFQGAAPMDHQQNTTQWVDGGNFSDNLWNIEDMWFLQQQLNNNNNVV